MLIDYVDYKIIDDQKLLGIVNDFKSYGFDCECFFNGSKKIVFRLNQDLTLHDSLNDFFNWIKPVIVECAKLENNELKKQRQLREMLLNQVELVANSFGKEVYTLSLGRKE